MYDYAKVQLLGRATDDAKFFNLDDPNRTSRATFIIACNISFRKAKDIEVRSIFRKIVALGPFAHYIYHCQEDGGLKGRLINILGTMDNEINKDESELDDNQQREIILVAPSSDGFMKIMDRPNDYEFE